MTELWLWVKSCLSGIFADGGGVMGQSSITERPPPPGSMRYHHLMRFNRHKHDYDMVFYEGTLNYKLICNCGDIAPDMETALRRMGHLRPWPGKE